MDNQPRLDFGNSNSGDLFDDQGTDEPSHSRLTFVESSEQDNTATQDRVGDLDNPMLTPTQVSLVERVIADLGPIDRQRIPRSIIEKVVEGLALSEGKPRSPAPRLRIVRLIFSGVKTEKDKSPSAYRYDQTFEPGVNVLLVEKNHAGKSTVLKTIKYALTGHDNDYDRDVRKWISVIWLHFTLDNTPFTIHIDRNSTFVQGYVTAGFEQSGVEHMGELRLLLHPMNGHEDVSEVLSSFFLKRIGLNSLGWTATSSNGGVEERRAKWPTFFQALWIPDGTDEHLICDPNHAIGGQDHIIMSEFLGLQYSEDLNQLLIERTTATKTRAASKDELAQATTEVETLKNKIKDTDRELHRLETSISSREKAVLRNDSIVRFSELQSSSLQLVSELGQLNNSRERLTEQIRQRRNRAQRMREAIEIQRHFTSLEVRRCPRCTTSVDAEAVAREHEHHLCRVCGKEANTASHADVETMNAEVEGLDQSIQADLRQREMLSSSATKLESEIRNSAQEMAILEGVANQGWKFGNPTPEEAAQRAGLNQRIGELRYQLGVLQRQTGDHAATGEDAKLRAKVHAVVRSSLSQIAAVKNNSVLSSLGSLSQNMTRAFGATNITDVSCSALGSLSLKKHGEPVTFKTIKKTGIRKPLLKNVLLKGDSRRNQQPFANTLKNTGERLRVKLAFYIALMSLGQTEGGSGSGRHPGLLLIDQPASAEMEDSHVTAVVTALRKLDDDTASDLQIICFTSKSAFRQAADSKKIYGAQAAPNVF